MKKLSWKKKQFGKDMTVWIATIKNLDWEFSIELNENGHYEPYLYYGQGDDIKLSEQYKSFKTLEEAKNICNDWLHNLILNLNKWI